MATKTIDPVIGSDSAHATKKRWGLATAVAVTSAIGTCDAIDVRDYRDLAVKPSAGVTALSVYASETVGGTYVLVDSIGTNGSVTVVASKWNVLDTTKIAPFGWIKLLAAGADGTVSITGKT